MLSSLTAQAIFSITCDMSEESVAVVNRVLTRRKWLEPIVSKSPLTYATAAMAIRGASLLQSSCWQPGKSSEKELGPSICSTRQSRALEQASVGCFPR